MGAQTAAALPQIAHDYATAIAILRAEVLEQQACELMFWEAWKTAKARGDREARALEESNLAKTGCAIGALRLSIRILEKAQNRA